MSSGGVVAAPAGALVDPDDSDLARATFRRVSARLIPFLFVLYLFSYVDRTNVAIAALQMNGDLHFSAAAYAFGAGVFALAYALVEVPSNLVLARVGARRWIARIMITWGLIASAMMFVRTPAQFYAARFLLGAAEAGFFPGMLYYLSEWIPATQRGRAIAGFVMAVPLSATLGGPLGGWLLGFDGRLGLRGWQWVFLVEGIPSVLLGVATLFYLTDRPEDAQWLSDEQRGWLVQRLRHDRESRSAAPDLHPLKVLADPIVWVLSLVYFLSVATSYNWHVWGPITIRDALHTSNALTGWIWGAVAALAAVVGVLAGASSDYHKERFLHAAAGSAAMAVGFITAALFPGAWGPVIGFVIMGFGMRIFMPAFWCIPTLVLRGTAAAAGLALINSVGNVGAFAGPYAVGLFKDATGGTRGVYLAFAGLSLCAGALLLLLRRQKVFAPRGEPATSIPSVAGVLAPETT
jgi:ACS family tartrate transporter-like MFS transporter